MGTRGSSPQPACAYTHPSLTPLLDAAHANFCTREDPGVHRGQQSVLQAALGRLALGKEGGRQTKGSLRGDLAPGQAAYSSASATPCLHTLQAPMGPVGVRCWVSVPQRGVSEEMLHVKCLQTEAVKQLGCDNMTYLKTGARSVEA